jgi:glycyl-tRNA synthetase beta chain
MTSTHTSMSDNLLVELLVEELPPKVLAQLGNAFASSIAQRLYEAGLTDASVACDALQAQSASGTFAAFATPRRLAVQIAGVRAKADDVQLQKKLMPVAVGLDANGQATPALLKKLASMGLGAEAVPGLKQAPDGKAQALFVDSVQTGLTLQEGLQQAIEHAIRTLPIPKVMTYQLHSNCDLPGWSSVNFVRPAHGLVALHGGAVVPVTALGLMAGNTTKGHRFEAKTETVTFAHANDYVAVLEDQGAVVASFTTRLKRISAQLDQAAAAASTAESGVLKPIDDVALLHEVCALVERPNVVTCSFEPEFLQVPQECLILTMKANQKYFPLLDASGKLSNQFLVVSNISPDDASQVIGGNERVVRPRLADAQFFFNQDRKKSLAARVPELGKVVYHNKLGTQGERSVRVAALAAHIAQDWVAAGHSNAQLAQQARQVAEVAKCDLLTDMVGEFPELQGVMGGYYARHDGLGDALATAIEDHYRPRFAGDDLPRNDVGLVVALADKLETLVGMFGIGNVPTGERDPFALRRHALGVVRMLIEANVPLSLNALIQHARSVFGDLLTADLAPLQGFVQDRMAGMLREQGFSAQAIDAVLALSPAHLADVPKRLNAVRTFADMPESEALAAANKRIGNILKKSADEAKPVDASLFEREAEGALLAAMQATAKVADAAFEAGDYTASLQGLAALRAPVDTFFNDVMVNADDAAVRANRLGLLSQLHATMNRVADLSRLAI